MKLVTSALLILMVASANAQSIEKERLADWQFRFYACKNAAMNAAVLVQVMTKNNVTDQSGLDNMQEAIGPAVAQQVTEHEKSYQFSEAEAVFVSDLTFAVLGGLLAGGFELTPMSVIGAGSDTCIAGIDALVPG